MSSAKNSRINLRASAAQATLIRRAADAQRKSISEFILESACQSAESALYDVRTIRLDEKGWKQFESSLARKGREVPELVELFKEKTPWH
ncbi:MAG: DUF1778 domain-containing protein [Candidatus Binataceae bacterium]